MFKHTLQADNSLLCILHASGSAPLPPHLWSAEVGKGGAVTTRATDEATGLGVIDITGPSAFISCPPEQAARAGGELGIRLAHLNLLLKPLQEGGSPAHTSIEVTLRDAAGSTRHLRASTAQKAPRVTPHLASLPLVLSPPAEASTSSSASSGWWCRVRLDLADLLARAYPGSPPLAEVSRLRIHSTGARLRCVFFADRAYTEGELPPEFRLVVGAAKVGGGAAGGGDSAGVVSPPPASPVACVD